MEDTRTKLQLVASYIYSFSAICFEKLQVAIMSCRYKEVDGWWITASTAIYSKIFW